MTAEDRVEIRRARLSDLHVVVEIVHEAVAWMKGFGESLWTDAEVRPEAIETDVATGNHYLVHRDDCVLGTFLMQDSDPDYWPEAATGEALYLHRIVIRRAFAGAGHSRAIRDFAEAEARRRGISYLRLDCDRERAGLNTLYAKLGFRFHSEVEIGDYYGNRYQMAVDQSKAKG